MALYWGNQSNPSTVNDPRFSATYEDLPSLPRVKSNSTGKGLCHDN